MLMLIFIYYFKNLLSFHDIETFFGPITSRHFSSGSQSSGLSLEDIYREVSSLEEREMEHLKADVSAKFPVLWTPLRTVPPGKENRSICVFFPLYANCPLMYI